MEESAVDIGEEKIWGFFAGNLLSGNMYFHHKGYKVHKGKLCDLRILLRLEGAGNACKRKGRKVKS